MKTENIYNKFNDYFVDLINYTIIYYDKSFINKNNENYMNSFNPNYVMDFCNKYLFIHTINFSFRDLVNSNNINKYANLSFNICRKNYKHICQKILGDRFRKRMNLQPLCMSFLDVDGTRSHKGCMNYTGPHIHSILLIHPKTIDRFNELLTIPGSLKTNDSLISGDHIEKFYKHGKPLPEVISYFSKFARNQTKCRIVDIPYCIYPYLEEKNKTHKTIFKYIDVYMDNYSLYQ